MRWPSGDQVGLPAYQTVPWVSGVRPVPSASTIQTFCCELRLAASAPSRLRFDSKTIRVPSGDHSAKALSAPAAVALVSGCNPVPSALMTHRLLHAFSGWLSSPLRFRNDWKSTRLPSGDQRGSEEKACVDMVSGT